MAKITISGNKEKMKRLAKHLRKEHPSIKRKLKLKLKNKKGSAYVWLYVLLGLFIISIIYLIMTPAWIQTYNFTQEHMTVSTYDGTFQKLETFWWAFPVLLIVGLIIWGIVSSLRRDPNYFEI